MKKRSRKKYKDSVVSSKIEGARDKIFKATDLLQISMIFFPQKAAKQKRTAFIAMYSELRNATEKKLESFNHIPFKYSIKESVMVKARSKMARLGLIAKYGGYWTFSRAFENSMLRLLERLERLQTKPDANERRLDAMYIEAAKELSPVEQKRKVKQKNEEKPEIHPLFGKE